MSEKGVERIKGILEEFDRASIIMALEAMEIQTPVTTIATDSADIVREKLKTIVSVLESSRFNRVMKQIDTSKEIRDEAKGDVVGYLRKEGIEFPEGVDMEVVVQETKKKPPKHVEIHIHVHLHAI